MASNGNLYLPGTSQQPPSTSQYCPMEHTSQLQWHPQHFGDWLGASQSQPRRGHDPVAERLCESAFSSNNGVFMVRPCVSERTSDESTKFTIHKYPDQVLATMNEMRLEGSLCDITLKVKDGTVHAHKVVLAAFSSYFRAMFTRWREATCTEVELHEQILSVETLRTLVEFAYTKVLNVNQSNVQSLLESAMFLEICHVVEACTVFMEQQMDASNCIGFAHFAQVHGCRDLETKAKKFIYEHFCEVIKYDEFLTLSVEDMLDVLRQEELNIRCETQVFQAVVRWVEHDSGRRMCQLEELLEKVRLSHLAPCFLEDQLQQCLVIQQVPRCVQLILEKLHKLYQHKAVLDCPRKPCKPLVIYSVGGFYRKVMDSLKNFECYNPLSKEWTRLPDLPSSRCGAGVTSLKGLIYVVGGRTMRCRQGVDACALDVYDPAKNKWTTLNPMGVPRNRVGVGVVDGKIYAVGGCSGGELHRSAERYDPETDEWERLPAMQSVRMSTGVAVVNRLLYVVGGFDGRRRLSSVECYHPEENTWRDVEPLRTARSGAGVGVLNGLIYAVGGYNDEQQLRSVERYDPSTRVWEEVAPLSKVRSGVSVAVLDNRLYALGGYDGSDFLPCVESYDPTTDQWQQETVMLCARSGHGVAVEREPDIR